MSDQSKSIFFSFGLIFTRRQYFVTWLFKWTIICWTKCSRSINCNPLFSNRLFLVLGDFKLCMLILNPIWYMPGYTYICPFMLWSGSWRLIYICLIMWKSRSCCIFNRISCLFLILFVLLIDCHVIYGQFGHHKTQYILRYIFYPDLILLSRVNFTSNFSIKNNSLVPRNLKIDY